MPGYDWGDGHGPVHSRPMKHKQKKPKPPVTTGGIHGPGPQDLGRGNLLQGMEYGPDGKPRTTAAYNAMPPAPQQLPPDPQAQAEQLAATRQLQVGDAYGLYQKGNVGYDTGYNAAGARDYTNPYSQAALLEESYKRSQTGTQNGYASQGQLYSGAYGRMQGENDRNYSIGSNDLRTSASRAYQNVDWTRAQNYATYGTGNDQSAFAAILRALGAK